MGRRSPEQCGAWFQIRTELYLFVASEGLHLRGLCNTVGTLLKMVWPKEAFYRPRFTCRLKVRFRRVRDSNQDFKQSCFSRLQPTCHHQVSLQRVGSGLRGQDSPFMAFRAPMGCEGLSTPAPPFTVNVEVRSPDPHCTNSASPTPTLPVPRPHPEESSLPPRGLHVAEHQLWYVHGCGIFSCQVTVVQVNMFDRCWGPRWEGPSALVRSLSATSLDKEIQGPELASDNGVGSTHWQDQVPFSRVPLHQEAAQVTWTLHAPGEIAAKRGSHV